jgi:hypothetical protein
VEVVLGINSSERLTLNGRPIAANGDSTGTVSGSTENFVRIGHSLLCLITGILGGLLSRPLYARKWQSARSGPIR